MSSGIGVTIEKCRGGEIILQDTDCWGGSNLDSPQVLEPEDYNAIGIIESYGIARALMVAAGVGTDAGEITIVTDRMATIRSLQLIFEKGKWQDTRFHLCLKHVAQELFNALRRHKSIKFVHLTQAGFDKTWLPDVLSRIAFADKTQECILPVGTEQIPFDKIEFYGHKKLSDQLYGTIFARLT